MSHLEDGHNICQMFYSDIDKLGRCLVCRIKSLLSSTIWMKKTKTWNAKKLRLCPYARRQCLRKMYILTKPSQRHTPPNRGRYGAVVTRAVVTNSPWHGIVTHRSSPGCNTRGSDSAVYTHDVDPYLWFTVLKHCARCRYAVTGETCVAECRDNPHR